MALNAAPRSKEELLTLYLLEGGVVARHIENLFEYTFNVPREWKCDFIDDKCKYCRSHIFYTEDNFICTNLCSLEDRYSSLLSQNTGETLRPKMELARYFKSDASDVGRREKIWRSDIDIQAFRHNEVCPVRHDMNFSFVKWYFHQPNDFELKHQIKTIRKNNLDMRVTQNTPTEEMTDICQKFMGEMTEYYIERYKYILSLEQELHYKSINRITKELMELEEKRKQFGAVAESKLCVICQINEKKFMPSCGHYAYCADCIARLEECALCKQYIEDEEPIRVFE